MRFFSLIAVALAASSVEAAAVHNQAHAKGAAKMHGPHTELQLAQVKGKRSAFHGPLEKPLSLSQTKAKNKAKLKNRNRNKMNAKMHAKNNMKNKGRSAADAEDWYDDIDWEDLANRGNAAVTAGWNAWNA